MSTTRELTIWCDTCTEWRQFSEMTAVVARKELKRYGWTHRAGVDMCPNCARENK